MEEKRDGKRIVYSKWFPRAHDKPLPEDFGINTGVEGGNWSSGNIHWRLLPTRWPNRKDADATSEGGES